MKCVRIFKTAHASAYNHRHYADRVRIVLHDKCYRIQLLLLHVTEAVVSYLWKERARIVVVDVVRCKWCCDTTEVEGVVGMAMEGNK